MEEENHPVEGDTLILTGIVHKRAIIGLTLPCGYKLANSDQRFDTYEVDVIERDTRKINGRISTETLTLETEDGDVTKVTYRGREPIAGVPGSSITESNSQGAQQAYNWKKA
jgi:hypothetical protein